MWPRKPRLPGTETAAIHGALKTLQVPTLIVWGLQDIFFDVKWAYWLKDTIPARWM
jgi:pimeloyl-ACP methyl ester carboxylesterase